MNELFKTRLISLLFEPSLRVINKEMRSAYGNFIEQIFC
ncbi:hypothetical protein M2135_000401 [Parabacteroides sp. PF5-9]|nr:hypothetical protein [Parabacteroides sp. PF5-9]